jgi:hypothetical protein
LQNYTVGKPAPVLYIKNLDKEVVFDDFFYIFVKLANLDTCWMPIFGAFVSNCGVYFFCV